MAQHEISPGQINGLLLLLVLGPLIPTALMLRLMIESVKSARSEARDEMEEVYQHSLAVVAGSLERQWAAAPPSREEAPRKIVKFFRSVLDPSVAIRLADENGQPLSGNWHPAGNPIATTTLEAPYSGWTVQVYLQGRDSTAQSTENGIALFAWPVGLVILANLIIAGAAGFELRRQIKMQELRNSTLATVSHELKTPVASMRLLLDTLLEGRYRGEGQLREYLELATRENFRLGRLIENFLTLSRLERDNYILDKSPFPPNEVVDAALDSMRVKLSGAHVETRLAEGLPPVVANRDALSIVMLNLLENAWKYTGKNKRIEVETRREDDRVIFSVQDNGIGIDKSEHARIFERFYQIDQKLTRSAEGCGLGLSIVKHIVDAHGGSIVVESEPGKGSRFLVSIPAMKQI
jgi:signal transduction histidine kinase